MTETVNYNKFREVLIKAIGNRSQREFSKLAGISAGNLNRMLGNTVPPRDFNLRKIAAHAQNGVTLKMLMDAREYDEKVGHLSGAEKADKSMELIHNSFRVLSEGRPVFDSIKAFVREAVILYEEDGIKVNIGRAHRIRREDSEAESAVSISLWFDTEGYTSNMSTIIGVLFWQTKGGRVIIDRVI